MLKWLQNANCLFIQFLDDIIFFSSWRTKYNLQMTVVRVSTIKIWMLHVQWLSSLKSCLVALMFIKMCFHHISLLLLQDKWFLGTVPIMWVQTLKSYQHLKTQIFHTMSTINLIKLIKCKEFWVLCYFKDFTE